jgi:hypothetical protein
VTVTNPGDQVAGLNKAVSLQIQASNSVPTVPTPLTYAATGLPPGLSIDPSTGLITGTPSAIGSYNSTVTVDGHFGGPGGTASVSFTWNVFCCDRLIGVISRSQNCGARLWQTPGGLAAVLADQARIILTIEPRTLARCWSLPGKRSG